MSSPTVEVGFGFGPSLLSDQPAGMPRFHIALLEVDAAVATG
jgi:hypothetical protein